MSSPLPLLRHQSSLESIINYSTRPLYETNERIQARSKLYRIIEHFEATDRSSRSQYSRPKLVRFTYEYALSEQARDNFLRFFFESVGLAPGSQDEIDFEELCPLFLGFADHLLDNFFLPLKASTRKTPQPTPVYDSAIRRRVQGGTQDFAGTSERVSALRGACLVRDHRRCVISRRFDQTEAVERFKKNGDDAQDDDGRRLVEDTDHFDTLEVAHILPHSLTKINDPSKQAALIILNLFDSDITYLIEGIDIDRPRNAVTLTHGFHALFGNFDIFFEPVPDQVPHTYKIDTFLPRHAVRHPSLPVTRTLYLSESRTVDPPLPRLLAVHNAIAHILHFSAAGAYIDRLLRDMDENGIQADGSTELGRLVKLSLGGWLHSGIST